jgi:dipeptidyl aminopeptidase/acylaminoacyl peptidase
VLDRRFPVAWRQFLSPRRRCLALAACVLLAAATSAETINTAPPPVEAFATLAAQTEVALTPDGHRLAWIDQQQAQPRVVMFDVLTRKTARVLAVPRRVDLEGLYWNDNATLLIEVCAMQKDRLLTFYGLPGFDNGTSRHCYIIAADVSGGPIRNLPSEGEFSEARFLQGNLTKPHTVIMSTYGPCKSAVGRCLLEVDTQTGKGTVIKVGNRFTLRFIVDRDGRPVAREDWDWQKHEYRVFALFNDMEDGIREIFHTKDTEQPRLRELLPDGSALVLLAANGHSHRAAWAVPLDGSPMKLLAEDPDADITITYADRYTGATVGVYESGSKGKVRWLEAAAEHRYEVLERAFPGQPVQVYGWTADGTKTIALVSSPSRPPIYYLVDFTSQRADIVAEEFPALAGVQLGEARQITYRARDGTSIPAYLTMPPAKPTGASPLVVLPHDGPNERDYFLFSYLAQFLATRGYVVLQPQFRGSEGFGEAFRVAGYRQWGGLMQDDVTDGVKAMIEQGVADPHHICIVGSGSGGYSGYVALAGAAFTPDLYRCAVSINGITDLPALMRQVVPDRSRAVSTSQSAWDEHVGAPNDPALATKSPINSVKEIKIPVLIAYGAGAVPSEQSKRMASALRAAGKSVTAVEIPGEDNWQERTDALLLVNREIEKFLKEHL